ncbi:MAG: hypothetical protein KatS3mg124_1799 [Porticoccaceae bacterium]|nr:MAG: hypothetical protein KatS3mg124_1799 [Porticoccaceae bacterium]
MDKGLRGFRRRTPLLFLAVALGAPALAQTGEGATALEEIVITARRREERLADVPIAVSAFTAEEILRRGVRTDSDLQFVAPGLTIRQTQGNNSLTYSLRGQSADTFSGSPSAVVTYLNEVPLPIPGASSLYDLESVQVLKGPQGTLFGRNATGGAVLFYTAKPTPEQEARLRVRGGNLDLREVEGMVNLPLVEDELLLRAAFDSLRRDGYIDNLLTGRDHGRIERDSARLSLTWRPAEGVENTAVFSYSENHSINTGASYVWSVYAPGETHNGYALNGAAGFLFGPGLDVFGPGLWETYLAAHPEAHPGGLLGYLEEQRRLGPYKTMHPGDAHHDGKDWIFTNTTSWELAADLRLKNIFGAYHYETDSEQPALGAPFVVFVTQNLATGRSGNETAEDSYSNELQLLGSAAGGRLEYILGLFLQHQKTETLWPQTYFKLDPIPGFTVYATNHFGITTDSAALYGQGTLHLTERFGLTAGLRYTREHVQIEQLKQADYLGVPGWERKQDEVFRDPSWEVGLEWQAGDALLAYLKTRGSFRSGGFNGSAPPFDADATRGGNKFDPERVRDLEAGFKYEGELAGRPLRASVAAYRQWVEDVQRIEFPDPAPYPNGIDPQSIAVTANIPEMEVDGVELEVAVRASERLSLGFAGAWTDARFTDGETELFGVQYRYGPVANTPEKSWVVWADLRLPVADPGELILHAEYYGQDSFYFSNTADSIAPRTELPSYELLNARLDWQRISGSGLSLALFGKNLLDEEHFVGGMPLGASLGHNAAAVGEPRTWGVELTWEW